MLEKTEGLVLKTVRYSESSVIAKIFTREKGLVSFIIPGLRSSRNKSRGNLFQPLQYLELDIYFHPEKNLLKLKEYRPAYIYKALPYEMSRQAVGIFALEVLSKCLHEHEINTCLYDYIRTYFEELDSNEPDKLAPQKFLLALSRKLGIEPLRPASIADSVFFNLQEGKFSKYPGNLGESLDESSSKLLYNFLYEENGKLSIIERNEITDALLAYLKIHIPNFGRVSSLEILRQILR